MRERVCTHTRNALPTGPAEEPAAEGAEQPASGGIPVHSCYFCFARVRICGWVGALVGDKIGETRRVLVSAMHGMILTARVTRTGICRACRRWKCPKWSCRHGWGARRGNLLRAHPGKGPHLAESQASLRCPRSRCLRSRRSRGNTPETAAPSHGVFARALGVPAPCHALIYALGFPRRMPSWLGGPAEEPAAPADPAS